MLEVLVDRFLEPLQQEKLLPKEKMSFITANIQTVVVQQKQFKGRIEVCCNNNYYVVILHLKFVKIKICALQ